MCNRYYFVSSRAKDLMTGSMLISTSKDLTVAKNIAKRKFKEYGYKGKPVHVVPFAVPA